MRTFSCFISDSLSTVPTLALILAEDDKRARVLARRELMDARRPLSVEIRENGKFVAIERVKRAPRRTARRPRPGFMRACPSNAPH